MHNVSVNILKYVAETYVEYFLLFTAFCLLEF
ncbi:hypothetical protein FHS57_004740 [Runella defluvii]|uniref:Uncharacterized protein n=1 Tax=Runella defluvii TaxID=370973 RepID=A0A7W6ESH4_9BACT|nr:hypothetical protein [Runella defluvii]